MLAPMEKQCDVWMFISNWINLRAKNVMDSVDIGKKRHTLTLLNFLFAWQQKTTKKKPITLLEKKNSYEQKKT